ncbi:MAG: DUF3800 domain-containing protein [Desulfurivibrionaceae bacterium]|nr:DUF3800 domain-containing protein [Desulfurivibrionaceae bacterium]
MTTYNVYCDESCHLEQDHIPVMVLGAVWCPQDISKRIGRDIRAIKVKHGFKPYFEIKWTKVSAVKQDFYHELVDYFFDNHDLHFRALVVPDKTKLKHELYAQDHNIFYYKMFFYVLRNILENGHRYRVYLDIKDSLGREKIDVLADTLHNASYDFDRKLIEHMQHIHSHEVEQLQLADLFIGAIGYVNRGLTGSEGKLALINHIRQRSRKSLVRSTLPSEQKFNVFIWEPREG